MSVASSPSFIFHIMFGANMSMVSRLACEASIVGKCFGSLFARAGNGASIQWLDNSAKPHSSELAIRFVEHIMKLIEMLSQKQLRTIALDDSLIEAIDITRCLQIRTWHIFFVCENTRMRAG